MEPDLMKVLFAMTQPATNEVIDGKGFFISYNPSTDVGEETALSKGDKYYILLGDYRKQYKKIIKKGYGECKKLYKKLIKEGAEVSPWSN